MLSIEQTKDDRWCVMESRTGQIKTTAPTAEHAEFALDCIEENRRQARSIPPQSGGARTSRPLSSAANRRTGLSPQGGAR